MKLKLFTLILLVLYPINGFSPYGEKNPISFLLKTSKQTYIFVIKNSMLSRDSYWYYDYEKIKTIDGLRFNNSQNLLITAQPMSLNFLAMIGQFDITDISETFNYTFKFFYPFYFGKPKFELIIDKFSNIKCNVTPSKNENLHTIICD